jgi:hypothetical protein
MATTPQALTPEQIQQIIAAGRGNTVNIGGLLYGGNWADQGSGESMQEGPLQSIYASTGVNQAGQPYYEYNPTGSFVQQGVTQKVDTSLGGAIKDITSNPGFKILLAAYGANALSGAGGLFDGAATAAPAAGDIWAAEMAAAAPASEVAAATTAANAAASGLTASQIANLAKAGINVAGLMGVTKLATNTGGGGTTAAGVSIPTQSAPQYTPEYYAQLQNTYNQIMPGVPRDVVSNLASWYGSGGNVGGGMMSGGNTVIPTPVIPKQQQQQTPVVNLGSTGYQWATNQGGMTPMQYLNNINQWILDNPNATASQIKAEKAKYGISDVDVQTALGQSTFSDATKYALTHDMGLADINTNILDWINKNPAATNAQIQAEQAKYNVSDEDIARALTEKNASAAKEYAIVHDIGLDQYYKNIANAAQSGISPSEAVAQMKQYGVSPADVQAAYSMFAPKAGLTLDEVLAAYKG